MTCTQGSTQQRPSPRPLKHISTILLLLILAVAGVLRFWNFDGWSLSNDELSAWTRLQYDSVGEVIDKGVHPDFHPAGIQLFLYGWTNMFGDSPFALRLPFVIFGILGVFFTYLVGKKWFGTTPALFAAATIAVLQIPLLYSQIARPYSSGFFFIMGMVYFWSGLLSDKNTAKWKNITGFSIFAALCFYDHYFCGLVAGIVGLSGLLFLNKTNIKSYLIACVLIILLFLPHISISLEQVARGGLGSWLGAPGEGFLWKFLFYNLYDSWIFLAVLSLCIFLGFYFGRHDLKIKKLQIIALLWFIIPFTVAWCYSVYVNPILQYSILIFCLPFLILFLFSFYSACKTRLIPLLSVLLLGTGIHSAVFEDNFYAKQQFGVFKELAEKTQEWDNKYGKDNITRVYNLIAHEYIDYYFDRTGYKPSYQFMRGDDPGFLKTLKKTVDSCQSKYFLYAWSNNAHPNPALDVIFHKFCEVASYQNNFNSQIIIFKKREWINTKQILPLWVSYNWWPGTYPVYDTDTDTEPGIAFDYQTEYYPVYDTLLQLFFPGGRKCVSFAARFIQDSVTADILLVTEFRRGDSLLSWNGAALNQFRYKNTGHVFEYIFLSVRKPEGSLPTDKIKVYFWNKDLEKHNLMDLRVYSYPEMEKLLYE